MQYHPIADIWPLMSDSEIQSLAEDIQDQGQLNPIWTYEGKILDGRNRYRACRVAGIEPIMQPYLGDKPVQFAFAQNEGRRHLSSGQRAALGADLMPLLREEEEKRRREAIAIANQQRKHIEDIPMEEKVPASECHAQSRDEAARIAGTNSKYVNAAENIKTQAPDVFDKLKAGKITMQDAKREAARRPTTDEWLPDERERQERVLRGEGVTANFERDKHLIRWAQENDKLQSIDRGTKWGNPFILDADGTRDQVCDAYAEHYLPYKFSLYKARKELDGKVLACHCYPERCHGEELLNWIQEE